MRKKFLICFALFFLIYSTSVRAEIAFEDAVGRKINLDAPANKVAIVYNFVEYAAIAGEECYQRVVGIGKKAWFGWRKGMWNEYVLVCPEILNIEDIGLLRFGDFYMEKLISLQPDILILPKWQYESVDDTQKEQFKNAGIVLVVTDYANQALETHEKSTLAIGHAIGKLDKAREINEYYRNRFMTIKQLVEKAETAPRVYVEKGQKGPDTIDESWSKVVWGAMIDTAGASNIADGVIPAGKHGQLSREKIIESNPEYIFIVGSNWVKSNQSVVMGYGINREDTNRRLLRYAARLGWSSTKAIKDKKLYAIHHGLARGLMDFTAIQYISKQLHPDLFQDVDPEYEIELFHEKFLPVKYKGTWFHSADFD